jgi:hypothetical protein
MLKTGISPTAMFRVKTPESDIASSIRTADLNDLDLMRTGCELASSLPTMPVHKVSKELFLSKAKQGSLNNKKISEYKPIRKTHSNTASLQDDSDNEYSNAYPGLSNTPIFYMEMDDELPVNNLPLSAKKNHL